MTHSRPLLCPFVQFIVPLTEDSFLLFTLSFYSENVGPWRHYLGDKYGHLTHHLPNLHTHFISIGSRPQDSLDGHSHTFDCSRRSIQKGFSSLTSIPSRQTINDPKTMPPKKDEPAGPSQELVLWHSGNRPFTTAQEIIQYIETLPELDQATAIERLRSDLVRMTLTNDQVLHDIYSWIMGRFEPSELNNSDNREAWRRLREAHTKVRSRRKEGRDALAGEGKWCTTAFWDDVVEPLTGASADVTDALRKIKKKDLKPIEVMQRGCLEMFRRLSGESTTRFRKDRFCTGGDLKIGNLGQLAQEQLTQPKFFSSLLQNTLTLDEHGFLWHHPPKASIAATVQQQRDQDARKQASVEKEPTTPYGFRKRQKKIADEDDINAVPDPEKTPIPRFRKPARGRPSPYARKTSEMDKIFNQLNVVRTKTARQRAASLQRSGKSAEEWPSPNRLPIPVKNSTRNQNAIWEVIEKRVKGVKDRRLVDISQEASQVMKLPAAQLVQEVEGIATGLSKTNASEDTLLVYTQCLLDVFRTQIVVQKAQTDEMSQLRSVVATWHHQYRERSITLIPGSVNQGGVQLDHYDLSTLLIGDGYDGWLNGDLIHGILNITADRANQYIVPARAFDFWHQGNHPDNIFYVPDNHPNLITMVHWGNHWAIMTADRSSGVIHYFDSEEIPGRRQVAVASMRSFLNLHPGYNTITWRESDLRSQQQGNHYDCGIWAIANAWAWMERSELPTEVGLADRLRVGRGLLDAAQLAEQGRQPVPTTEVEFMGTRNINVPVQGNASVPASRVSTPRAEGLATAARQAQQLCDHTPSPMSAQPKTPKVSTPGSDLSSVRNSLLATPPGMRTSQGPINTRSNRPVTVTGSGSPIPRDQNEEGSNQAGQQAFGRRVTRHGKEY